MYKKEDTILASDVDFHRSLRISSLFTKIQEASVAHTTQLGFGRSATLDRGYLWVISRMRVVIHRLPVYDEDITILSWPTDMIRMIYPRCCRILSSATGEVLVESHALWALIDEKSRHALMPSVTGVLIPGILHEELSAYGIDPTDFVPAPGGAAHVRIPDIVNADVSAGSAARRTEIIDDAAFSSDGEESMPLPFIPEKSLTSLPYAGAHQKTFRFTDTDINGHVHNTHYLDAIEDLLPISWYQTHRLSDILICYEHEILPETTETLLCRLEEQQGDCALHVSGYSDPSFSSSDFTARLLYQPLADPS